jgi:hypothetical protein
MHIYYNTFTYRHWNLHNGIQPHSLHAYVLHDSVYESRLMYDVMDILGVFMKYV